MKKTKMSLANMQGKLSREEMKNIIGGDAPALCPGIIPCRKDDVDSACPDQERSTGCTCRKDSDGDYTCLP